MVLLCLFGGLIGLACFVLWIWMLIDCLTNNGIPSRFQAGLFPLRVCLPLLARLKEDLAERLKQLRLDGKLG